jgi:hypothetical protein
MQPAQAQSLGQLGTVVALAALHLHDFSHELSAAMQIGAKNLTWVRTS